MRLKYRDKQRLIALCDNVDWLIDRLDKKTLNNSERTQLYRITERKKRLMEKLQKGMRERYSKQRHSGASEQKKVQEGAGTGTAENGDSTRT